MCHIAHLMTMKKIILIILAIAAGGTFLYTENKSFDSAYLYQGEYIEPASLYAEAPKEYVKKEQEKDKPVAEDETLLLGNSYSSRTVKDVKDLKMVYPIYNKGDLKKDENSIFDMDFAKALGVTSDSSGALLPETFELSNTGINFLKVPRLISALTMRIDEKQSDFKSDLEILYGQGFTNVAVIPSKKDTELVLPDLEVIKSYEKISNTFSLVYEVSGTGVGNTAKKEEKFLPGKVEGEAYHVKSRGGYEYVILGVERIPNTGTTQKINRVGTIKGLTINNVPAMVLLFKTWDVKNPTNYYSELFGL